MIFNKDSYFKKVVVLVFNPCVYDSRVIKTSESLANSIYKVTVLCTSDPKYKNHELINNVNYIREGILTNYDLKEIYQIDFESKLFRSFKYLIFIFILILNAPLLILEFLIKTSSFVVNFKFHKRLNRKFKSLKRKFFLSKSFNSLYKIYKSLLRKFFLNNLNKSFNFIYKIFKKMIKYYLFLFQKFTDLNLYIFKLLVSVRNTIFHINNQLIYFVKIWDYLFLLKPDIIHANDLINLPIAGIYKIFTRTPFIYDSHELEMHRNAKYNSFITLYRKLCEYIFISKSDHVITVSESISKYLKNFYGLNTSPSVIYNSPKVNKFLSSDFSNSFNLRNKLGIEKKSKILIYVGAVTVGRGLENVLFSIKDLKDINFVTLGPKNPKVLDTIKKIIIDINLEERVFLLDPVPPNEVLNYIKSADASILPIENVCLSYFYCMPNKLFESVFAGLPVMVSDMIDMKNFVTKYKCGSVVNINCKKELKDDIFNFFKERKDFILSKEYKNNLVEKYSWEAQEKKLLNIYYSTLISK